MSHNSLAVNSSNPSRDGIVSSSTAYKEIRIGGGSLSDDYENSGASDLNNSTLYFYDPNPVNMIIGATITSSSGWVSEVTLPAGTYLLEAAFALSFSASGQFSFQWYDGTSSRGTRAQLGSTLSHTTESASPLAVLCITINSSTTFSVKSTSTSTNLNTVANQGTNISEQSYIRIRGF
tara:strand:+ start:20 stop:553 length:534 start_codon:yes stop_codon:yes gene_type:complete